MGESKQREQRILDAAADLITRYGYDKTSVDEIARAAGVSKGAIYLHFKSKEALFEALILRDADAIMQRFAELIDADPAGLTLFTLYRYALVVLDEAPLLKALYTHDRRVLGNWVHRMRSLPNYAQALNIGVEFVRYAQQSGMIRSDLDAEAVAYLLRALRFGLLTMEDYAPQGQPPPPLAQIGDALAEMISSGLAPRDGEDDPERSREAMERLIEMQREQRQVIHEKRSPQA
ncbi:MAG: helix-turn-helix transcriptional regulator [Anaerolineae bacterium]|nr:helix-turn-helix transcriptional regulator [Anaerolineae bacterium]